MNTLKVRTAKNNLEAVRLFDDENRTIKIIVRQQTGHFGFYDFCNYIADDDQTGLEEFVSAYENFMQAKEEKKLAKIAEAKKIEEEKKLSEEKRIADFISDIKVFSWPEELCEYLNLDVVETARHWSDLHNGRSGYGCKITSKTEYEDFKLAVKTLNIDGEFGELCHVAGAHHWTFDRFYGLEDYQNSCKKHFNGDNHFYYSQEESKDSYLERIKECDDIDSVKDIIKQFDELKAGYYDCNGNLEMLESDLESEDFCGYSYDNKTFQFGFKFEYKNRFNNNEQTENEE